MIERFLIVALMSLAGNAMAEAVVITQEAITDVPSLLTICEVAGEVVRNNNEARSRREQDSFEECGAFLYGHVQGTVHAEFAHCQRTDTCNRPHRFRVWCFPTQKVGVSDLIVMFNRSIREFDSSEFQAGDTPGFAATAAFLRSYPCASQQ